MTASDTSTIPTFEPPGPGSWEQDPVHFPRPMTRYFQETHPPPFKRGTNDFARFYGLLIDGLQIGYVNGFGYNQVLPAPDAEIPQRFAARRTGLRAEALARAASRLGRELQTSRHCQTPGAAGRRSGRPLRRRAGRLSDALSRPPFGHDRPAHALHRRCRAADRGFPRPCWRLDGPAALRAAGPDARFGGGVRGWLRRDGATEGGVRQGSLLPARSSHPTGDPAQVLASLRSLGGEAGAAVSGYLDLVGNRLIDGFDIAEPTALELPDALLRAIRIAVSGEAQAASDVDARIAEVRAQVPAAHQDRV